MDGAGRLLGRINRLRLFGSLGGREIFNDGQRTNLVFQKGNTVLKGLYPLQKRVKCFLVNISHILYLFSIFVRQVKPYKSK